MAGRTIAIGDIHGCADALDTIIRAVHPQQDDVIVALGDYVDRGPDSRRVIEQMLELEKVCDVVPLMGNHELMMLAALNDRYALSFWMQCGGQQTLESYGGEGEIPESHINFVRRCRRFHETDTHIFLHANYDPQQSLENQLEEFLFWHHINKTPPDPHCSGKTAVVGHTPQADGLILDLGYLICIDTYCFGSGFLTALDVHSRQCWQADKYGNLNID